MFSSLPAVGAAAFGQRPLDRVRAQPIGCEPTAVARRRRAGLERWNIISPSGNLHVGTATPCATMP